MQKIAFFVRRVGDGGYEAHTADGLVQVHAKSLAALRVLVQEVTDRCFGATTAPTLLVGNVRPTTVGVKCLPPAYARLPAQRASNVGQAREKATAQTGAATNASMSLMLEAVAAASHRPYRA